MWKRLLVMLVAAGWVTPSIAQIHGSPQSTTATPRNDAPLLRSTDPGASRFKATGRLRAGSSCTATLIAGADVPSADASALILTAGHCVEEMTENRVIVDQAADPAWTFTPAFFIDTQEQHVPFGIDRILYATMKNTDLAVLRLGATYGELARIGVTPLRLRADDAPPGSTIELAHAPTDGIPAGEQFLRLSVCSAEAPGPIFEERSDHRPWFWASAVPNDCPGVAGGTSGAPVVLQGGSAVVGVLNTTVSVEVNGCGFARPCELQGADSHVREGASYYMPLRRIAMALRADSSLDTSLLDPGTGVQATRTGTWITKSTVADGHDEPHPALWNVRVADATMVRYKTGPAGSIRCDVADGYSPPIPAQEQPLSRLPTQSAEGIHAACIIGQTAEGVAWQDMANATVVLRQIDDTPPSLAPLIVVYIEDPDAWTVYAARNPSEVVSLKIKYGPRDKTNCDDSEGYFVPAVPWEVLAKKSAPWRFCTTGADLAGNPSPVHFRDFEVLPRHRPHKKTPR